MANSKTAKIIMLSGGGTGGSVTPLLAVAAEIHQEDPAWRLVFVGTSRGPEKEMVAAFNREIGPLEYRALVSGKWRRYFSLQNFFDLFKIAIAFIQAFFLLRRLRPKVVISAGAFVSVPLAWAAALYKIPILIHQQDVRPGLANRLMAPYARVITVTFESSLATYGPRAIWTGNPIRMAETPAESSRADIFRRYELAADRPLILVTGGGTGSVALNELVAQAAPALGASSQIINITGRGKSVNEKINAPDYQALEFVAPTEHRSLIAAADLVISRCGLGTLTELSAFGKAAILIPLPQTHQEENAAVFAAAKAALVFKQSALTAERLVESVREVLNDGQRKRELENNISKVIKRGATDAIVGVIWEIIK